MTVATDAYEEAIAELKRDPALSGLLGPDALLLLWDPAQSQMLWYSPAAAPLARALANDDGSVDPQLPFGEWLRKAGEMAGAAPGIRLERVRLGADRTGSATMLACRCLRFSERQALLTIIVGAAPVPRARAERAGAVRDLGRARRDRTPRAVLAAATRPSQGAALWVSVRTR